MLGVLPYPVAGGKNGKPASVSRLMNELVCMGSSLNPPQSGKQPQDANKPKTPAFPAWSTFVPPAPPAAGLPPSRPLPTPGQQASQPQQQQQQQPLPPGQPNHQMTMISGAVPPPPGLDVSAGARLKKSRRLMEADETSPHVSRSCLKAQSAAPRGNYTRHDIEMTSIMCTASILRHIIQAGPRPLLCII